VWADTLHHAEQLHLLRVCFWGGLSTLAGTALLVFVLSYRRPSTIIARFASVCAVFGAGEIVVAGIAYRAIPLRDISGATRLDRVAWLQLGLYIGLMAVGVSTMISSGNAGRRTPGSNSLGAPGVGAGAAMLMHGLALATLELILISEISR
jgi:hypothetical protein